MSKAAMIGIGALALIAAAVIGAVGANLIDGDDNDADETVEVENASAPIDAPPGGGAVVAEEPDGFDGTEVAEPTADADDQAIPQAEAKQAEQAVLKIAGGGQVTDLDYSDDPGERYEAEVIRGDGSEVDIALDEQFREVPNQPYED